MNRYPEIGEHGLIGDLQAAALISTDGTVDWFRCPRFDSPSIFASLLDHDRGGHFRVAPDRDDYVSRQLYFPDTAILVTRFMTPEGVGEQLGNFPQAFSHLALINAALNLDFQHDHGPGLVEPVRSASRGGR
jgi:GH15 family glucan-1,4-alpha-glucosidase